jgi:aromatic ring-cleaving dioxygenase
MTEPDAPYHAHVYYLPEQRAAADALRAGFVGMTGEILFVGRMTDGKAGPHPIPQYEIHFPGRSLAAVVAAIAASGLRALVHPLTDDDLADHTSLAQWIGEPVALDLATLDPPGRNQAVARFGKSDF